MRKYLIRGYVMLSLIFLVAYSAISESKIFKIQQQNKLKLAIINIMVNRGANKPSLQDLREYFGCEGICSEKNMTMLNWYGGP